MKEKEIVIFDWQRILFNNAPEYLFEIAFRSAVMFILILLFLRITGKRGIKQLSIFELAFLISLGEASGGPMVNMEAAIVPSVLAFLIVFLIYRAVTEWISKSKKAEFMLEGKPVCILRDGVIDNKIFDKEDIAYDEFFAVLRSKQVEHLGQVKRVYRETNAELSVYLFGEEETRPGLTILPDFYDQFITEVNSSGTYSCTFCGYTVELERGANQCANCQKNQWLAATK